MLFPPESMLGHLCGFGECRKSGMEMCRSWQVKLWKLCDEY
jgi:hypothetical protein